MTKDIQKEITIFDYLPKILPVLDVLFISWIAFNSPRPLVTTLLNLGIPALGLLGIALFKKKGRWGFYMIGLFSSIPLFILNCWASPTCPTWLNEFTFIAGGLLLTLNFYDRLVVISFVLTSTIIPMLINHNSSYLITTIALAEIAVWFLLERSMRFMDMQKSKIEKQKRIIEEKNKEVIDSINYASRIQRTLITSEKYIESNLNRLMKK
jgi:hypothetical protein